MHRDWFILLLLLPILTIWFSLDHKRNVSGVGRNGNVLILLMTPLITGVDINANFAFKSVYR